VTDCSCAACKAACSHKPGWFRPRDIPKLAKLLRMTEAQLVRERLAIDYWAASPSRAVFVLAPANASCKPGEVYPFDPRGRCTFLTDDGRCSIHAAKPYECREALHSDSDDLVVSRKKRIVREWRTAKGYLRTLLGFEPKMPEPTVEDVILTLTRPLVGEEQR
jgi:Fe-S-cluster containining protein